MKLTIKDKKIFYFKLITIVLMLQSLRNISALGYTIVLLLCYMLFFVNYNYTRIKLKKISMLFLGFYIIFPIISFVQMPFSEFVTAFIRYAAIFPLYLFGICNSDFIKSQEESILKIFCLIIFVSSILIIYQTFFGNILFFIEVTARLGRARYTSLLGSTTVYATLAPVGILSMHNYNFFKRKTRIFYDVFVLMAGIICLSKAFFVNMLFVCFMMILIKKEETTKIKLKSIIVVFGCVLITGCILALCIKYTLIGDYFIDMIEYTFFDNNYGIENDLIDRLTGLPQTAFLFHQYSFLNLLFGVGFKGYSGVLGLDKYPMCHNNYFDIILSQGIIFFCVYMKIHIDCFIKTSDHKNNNFYRALIIYIFVNMLAGQWGYLTTFTAFIFLLINSNISNKEF